ncbi:MAG: ABC transporter substrate-binding protein [Acetobacteraceae bacterium]|nr:ABC transporter substrate-binding protein [Acetobacteraceae bacterium]
MRAWLGGALLAATLGLAPAQAQKSQDTLRIAWRDAIPNVDFYYNSLRTGLVVSHHVWDTLVYRDPETFQIRPQLATAWRYVDETSIEFDLRPGITFHDGSKFTADDVVYTVNLVLNDKQIAVPSNYSFIEGAEKVDDLKVRIRLKRVFPAALEYFAMVLPIYPKAYRERAGDDFSNHPVGTGPYKITKVDGVTEIDMERNDSYFDGPKGKPPIKKLVIKEVADATGELTQIVSGQADWIWQFSVDQLANLSKMPNLQTLTNESMRVTYMNMDTAGRTGSDNPLTKQKVRQAVLYAIDRQTMAKQFMPGGSRVLDAPCFPTQFGCDSAVATKYDYNPERAKALLAESGYPNGFDTELVTYLLPQWAQAVQGYLGAVGIRAKISQLQVGAVVQRSSEGKNPLEFGSWGSYSINDVSAFLPYFFAGGGNDYTRDPEVIRLVDEGGATTDPDRRRAAYTAAIRRITEQAYYMPTFTWVTVYAISKQLNFKTHRDELPRFYMASWK